MNEEELKYFRLITDTFTGVDGGDSFIKLKSMLEHFAEVDDYNSKKILAVLVQFGKLVKIAQDS